MSSTNKTTNYELSQFLGTDKPAWLTDYNSDMSKIDAGVHNAQSTATSADGKADSANTAIGTIANLTTDDKTSLVAAINEVDGHADAAQGTANSAETKANAATTNISNLTNYLNVGATNVDLNSSNMTMTGVGRISSASALHIVGNTDNSIVKIYGNIYLSDGTNGQNANITISNTGITPTSNITVNGCAIKTTENSGGSALTSVDALSYTINTNGTITFTMSPYQGTGCAAKFLACVIFVKNFNDQPE